MRRVGYSVCAAYIGVKQGTLRAWVSRRKVPHLRLGPQTVIFDLDAIDAWLAEHVIAPEVPTRGTTPGLRIVGGGEK